MKKVTNQCILNPLADCDGSASKFAQIPSRYNAPGKMELVDMNPYHAARHIATVLFATPVDTRSVRALEMADAHECMRVIQQLKSEPNGDPYAAFVYFDESTHEWLLRILRERGIYVFGVIASCVEKAISSCVEPEKR